MPWTTNATDAKTDIVVKCLSKCIHGVLIGTVRATVFYVQLPDKLQRTSWSL